MSEGLFHLVLTKFTSCFSFVLQNICIFFYAEGILKDYPAFLLQSSTVFFFLCSATFPVFTACCQQSRKEQFLFPMANFATMNQISYRVLSMFIILLLRKLVLPGADLSHCHEEPQVIKHLKSNILQFLCLKNLSKIYLLTWKKHLI